MAVSEAEWLAMWGEGDRLEFAPGDVIVDLLAIETTLYQVIKGQVLEMDEDNVQQEVLAPGDLFGIEQFLGGGQAKRSSVAGEKGASVLALTRSAIMDNIGPRNGVLMAKVFAMLGARALRHNDS
eukprot:TRINITY_DN5303_c0_g1_i2.p2 TRINITY_DN5303_c0_g1~~TRINITY_DN5303_c0_g1_i2.p2  ORF type:complete len:137 (-),score=66.78 TRINITY_DN5303_c0_g1_i2:406-780(-)